MDASEPDDAVADDACPAGNEQPLDDAEPHAFLGAGDEERAGPLHAIESSEVDVAFVDDIERTGLEDELVEEPDVVHFCVGNPYKNGDSCFEIEDGVCLDPRLVSPEVRPWEEAEAEVDGGGIDGVESAGKWPKLGVLREREEVGLDHRHRGVHEDAMVTPFVGVGEGGACDVAADAAVVSAGPDGTEAGDRLAETGAAGDLGEDHAKQLVGAGEAAESPACVVAVDGVVEGAAREEIDKLSEDGSALMHARLLGDGLGQGS